MDFIEAIKEMREGKKVRRSTYKNGFYRFIKISTDELLREDKTEWLPLLSDFEATDWEVHKHKED